jgi:tellurite resistance protein TerC
MAVPWTVWAATLVGLGILLLADLLIAERTPHRVSTREATGWVLFYVALAAVFAVGVFVFGGGEFGVQFVTGYLTEYSLSLDNLFIFLVIMASFAVPAHLQHRVLLIGIVLALALRGVFIAVGATLIANFVWVFFAFGGFLIWTAAGMFRGSGEQRSGDNALVGWVRRAFPVTDDFHGTKTTVRINGKRWLTPMFLVIVAIGSADLLFAVDSIPAIFGITQDPYLMFTANFFALMGLRQLYFLLGGLANRLVYLSTGLGIILAFIGGKLILHALHEYHLVPAWLEISNVVSLAVIIVVLAITAIASLTASRRTPQTRTEEPAVLVGQ